MRFSARYVFLLLATASLALLGASLMLDEMLRLHPCYLCNFQRFLCIVLAFFALCGALLPGGRILWGSFTGLAALGGVITAAQQSWMQYAPDQAIECDFSEPTLIEQIVNWLSLQWPTMFMVTGFCTSRDWGFLGLSLANWSAVCFFVLFALAVGLLFRHESKR